jgi:hypothetical protein
MIRFLEGILELESVEKKMISLRQAVKSLLERLQGLPWPLAFFIKLVLMSLLSLPLLLFMSLELHLLLTVILQLLVLLSVLILQLLQYPQEQLM